MGHHADPGIPESPLFVAEVADPESELEGWVAVHSSYGGKSSGGVRIYPDVGRREVELLAAAMTRKLAYNAIRSGGAKAGVRLPLDLTAAERARRLRRFGEHIAPLLRSRTFLPFADMNCSQDDLAQLYRGAGRRSPDGATGTAVDAAYSTMAGVMAAAEHRQLRPEDCRISIEGFGRVGRRLASEIAGWGGRIIGVSTRFGGVMHPGGLDVAELIAASEDSDAWVESNGGWEVVTKEEIFSLPMNIHVPCARVESITQDVAAKLRCSAVVPAANVPCTQEAARTLESAGVTLLPDFVTSCGGVIGPRLRRAGYSREALRSFFLGDFRQMLARLLAAAETGGETARELAMRECRENFRRLQLGESEPTPGGRFRLPGSWLRRGRTSRRVAEAREITDLTRARFSGSGSGP